MTDSTLNTEITCSNADNYTPACCDDNWVDQHNLTCEMLRNSGDNNPFLIGSDESLSGYRCHQFCRTDSTCTNPKDSDCVNYVKPGSESTVNRTIHNVDFQNQNSDHSCKTKINNNNWCDDRDNGGGTKKICTQCKVLGDHSQPL